MITLTSVMSHGSKIGPLWNTQVLIEPYAIRPALVINRDCILYNPGWLYLLRACHESISVSNLGRRRESKKKVTPSVFLIISWCGWGQVWKLVWLYSESIIVSSSSPNPPDPPLFLISVRHCFTSPSLSSSICLLFVICSFFLTLTSYFSPLCCKNTDSASW